MNRVKQKVKEGPRSAVSSTLVESTSGDNTIFNWLLFGLLASLAFIGILKHEMWRDELQAWLIARDSSSYGNMLYNLRYEGHPALWHTILFFATRITHNPVVMQIIHVCIALGAMAVLIFKSPFNRLQKVLITSGYFMFYEYSLISRNYAIGMLFLFLALMFYFKNAANLIPVAVCLFFMANSNLYALTITLVLTGIIVFEKILSERKITEQTILFSSIAIAGIMLAVYQIKPQPDSANHISWPNGLEADRVKLALSDIVKAYLPFPVTKSIAFWNTNIFIPDTFVVTLKLVLACLVFIGVFTFAFSKNIYVSLFYLKSTVLVILLTYVTFLPYVRYLGHLILILIASYWMHLEKRETSFKLPFYPVFQKALLPFFLLVLGVNSLTGLYAFTVDYSRPFSTAKETVAFLKEKKLDKKFIAVYPDYIGAGICAYSDTKVYYPQIDSLASFVLWNKQRNHKMQINEALNSTKSKINSKTREIIFISGNEIKMNFTDGHQEPLTAYLFPDSIQIDLLTRYPKAISGDDVFFVYQIKKQQWH